MSHFNTGNKYCLGRVVSEETKQKIRNSLKGRKLTEEHKLNISKAGQGRKLSTEHKKLLISIHTGSKRTTETRMRMSEAKGYSNGYHGTREYKKVHYWIKKQLGYPNKCENCLLVSDDHKVIHWANKSQKYLFDVNDWMRLCRTCHMKYDINFKKNELPYVNAT